MQNMVAHCDASSNRISRTHSLSQNRFRMHGNATIRAMFVRFRLKKCDLWLSEVESVELPHKTHGYLGRD